MDFNDARRLAQKLSDRGLDITARELVDMTPEEVVRWLIEGGVTAPEPRKFKLLKNSPYCICTSPTTKADIDFLYNLQKSTAVLTVRFVLDDPLWPIRIITRSKHATRNLFGELSQGDDPGFGKPKSAVYVDRWLVHAFNDTLTKGLTFYVDADSYMGAREKAVQYVEAGYEITNVQRCWRDDDADR